MGWRYRLFSACGAVLVACFFGSEVHPARAADCSYDFVEGPGIGIFCGDSFVAEVPVPTPDSALNPGIVDNLLDTIDGIGDDFVTIQTVAISDIVLPETIKTAVERKAQIEQETLTAQQNLAKARMEAQKVQIEAKSEADAKFIRAKGEANARAALGISPEQYTRLETAKIAADALKNAPNLVVVPANSILDTRALMGATGGAKGQ